MLALLRELEAETGPAKSLYLPSALDAGEKEKLIQQAVESDAILSDVVDLASDSATGAVLFWGVARKLLVLPHFPIREKYMALGYDAEPVRSLLECDFRVALILVRMGAFAMGVCRGEELVLSKVGSGLVHARHKKGGSSQKRFQRRRENEVDQFIGRVCGHVTERLEPRAKEIDYVVYGGGWEAILLLRKECRFLHQFDGCLLPPLLDIPSPRKAVLEAAISRVWSSSVVEWHEP
jgi:hypothetical protein